MKYIKKLPAFNLLKRYLVLLYIETLDKDFINEKEYIIIIKDYWKTFKTSFGRKIQCYYLYFLMENPSYTRLVIKK